MVAPICLAEGIDPTRFAIRWITPPSSSVITNGTMPPRADEATLRRAAARSAGAEAPSRITPPTPAATSGVADATSPSSTGTTTVWVARRRRLQVERTLPVEQVSIVAEIRDFVVLDEATGAPHTDTNETTRAIAIAPRAWRQDFRRGGTEPETRTAHITRPSSRGPGADWFTSRCSLLATFRIGTARPAPVGPSDDVAANRDPNTCAQRRHGRSV